MCDRQRRPEARESRMTVRTPEAVCYLMDACCRDRTPEQRAELEARIARLYYQHYVLQNKDGGTAEPPGSGG